MWPFWQQVLGLQEGQGFLGGNMLGGSLARPHASEFLQNNQLQGFEVLLWKGSYGWLSDVYPVNPVFGQSASHSPCPAL